MRVKISPSGMGMANLLRSLPLRARSRTDAAEIDAG
jgi:hypothetical protein